MDIMNKDWDKPLTLSLCTSKLVLIAPDGGDDLFGFRKMDKIENSVSKKIYCFGGSTTFGHGVSDNGTWPSFLKRNTGFEVFNCGVVKNDLKSSLHTLVSLLRLGHKPDVIIFLDGINEFSGYNFWANNQSHYIDIDTNYVSLNHFYEVGRFSKSRYFSLANFIFGSRGGNFSVNVLKNFEILFKNQERNILYNFIGLVKAVFKTIKDHNKVIHRKLTDNEKKEMVVGAAQSYLKSKGTIERIGKAYGISKPFFLLQPSFFDIPNTSEPNGKHIYLKELYKEITTADSEVIDISRELSAEGSAILGEMFYDWQHLNEKGNEILAKIIEKNIRTHSNLF